MKCLIVGTIAFLCGSLDIALAQTFTPHAEIRRDISLVAGWRFVKRDVAGAEQKNFDDQTWEIISIPHTWNARDGQDGGNDYYRGPGFYRRHFLSTPVKLADKFSFIQRRQHGNGGLGEWRLPGPASWRLRDVSVRNDLGCSHWGR